MYASTLPVSRAALVSGGAELIVHHLDSLISVFTTHLAGLFVLYVLLAYYENEHLNKNQATTPPTRSYSR